MIIYDHIFQGAIGFSRGLTMYEEEIEEKDTSQGANALWTSKHQLEQALYTLYELSHVINDLIQPLIITSSIIGKEYLFNESIQNVVGVATLALIAYSGYARDNQKAASSLKEKVVIFINDHAGNISQSIFLICTVTQCLFGNPIRGGVSLAIHGIGYLDRNGYIDFEWRLFLQKKILPITHVLEIITEETLIKISAAIELGMHASTSLQQPLFWLDRKICQLYGNIYPPIELTIPNEAAKNQDNALKFTGEELLKLDEIILELEKTVTFTVDEDGSKVEKQRKERFFDLELDYAHLQRPIEYDINGNAQFSTLNTLVNDIGFEGEALTRLVDKIEADDRFQKLLNGLFGEKPHLARVKREGAGWQAFIFEYGKAQVKALVNTLNATEKQPNVQAPNDDQEQVKSIIRQLSYDGDKKDLEDFLELLEDRNIRGDARDLEPRLKQAKFVISHLESLLQIIKTSDDQTKQDDAKLQAQHLLSILIVEAGSYCALGVQDAVNNCFQSILAKGKGTSNLQASLDALAQILRTQGFQQLFAPVASKFSFISDRHFIRQMKDYGGLGVGLSRTTNPTISEILTSIFLSWHRRSFWISNQKQKIERRIEQLNAKMDALQIAVLQQIDPAGWRVVKIARAIHYLMQTFWLALQTTYAEFSLKASEISFEYNANNLITCVEAHIGSEKKQRDRYAQWWQAYIQKVAGDDQNLQDKLEETITYNLFDSTYRQPLNLKYLSVMLIEMGFIKKPLPAPQEL